MRTVHTPVERFEAARGFRAEPPRLAVAIGLVATAVGSAMPWVVGTTGFGAPVALNGYVASGDGGFLVIFGLLIAGAALTRWAAESRAATVRLLPAVLAVALLATVWTAHQNAATEIRGLEYEGGEAALGLGIWVATAGALLMAAGGASLTAVDRLRRGPFFAPGELRAALDRRNLVPVLAGVVGALSGFGGVLAMGARSLDSGLVLLLLVGALVGMIVGGWSGYQLGRWLVLTPPGRDR
jgi:hypothetical protein